MVYGDAAGFSAYAAANGYTSPAGDIDAALARATTYLDGLYGRRFSGAPIGGAAQNREWPRAGAVDVYGYALPPEVVPARVINATYEAALLELASPGSLSATITPDQRKVLTKVDKIEWEIVPGGKDGVEGATPTSTRIEGILWPLLMRADLPAAMVV
ncbi:hypothetical protein L1787_13075 [Acuticoccus sp. M5D2P5]|uniref:DnaT-like ssDNA-binding protein n=1 Tax=Acuticoccus kalidii TaxID=2910977 RepID=UPI001F207C08|nr:DnaT-like ssDNA-binding protein [Acuticoccus kalidii]MCF3934342.1 hypothetical protein [Acuticoccus kalidii]